MDAPVRPCSDFDIYVYEKARTEDLRRSVAMEVLSGDDPSGRSFSVRDDEKVQAEDLLEESWFFGRRKTMSRCFSDPCTSSNFCQEMMVRNSYGNDHSPPPPTLPCTGRRGGAAPGGRPDLGPTKSNPKPVQNHFLRPPSLPSSVGSSKEGEAQAKDFEVQPNLLIAPSMPPCVGREGRGSILTRTTSLSPSDLLPPPQHASKGLRRSYSTARHRPPRKQEEGTTMSKDVVKEMRRRYLNQNKVMRKSLSDLEYEELQGFKDLGFTFEKEDLTPSVVNILPGLQDKGREEQTEEEDSVRRPYLSEAWLEQCSAPPIPNWVGKSSEQDKKAQIKFWARAVASNVRQEC